MGAIILDGAVIGKGSIVGAGAVVTKGTVIPPFSVVLGTPGKVVKTMPETTITERQEHAEHYWQLAQQHKGE
jgi:carbonic anhydrase/acetyltransferase-like protein (isoleucine patch superfamily)